MRTVFRSTAFKRDIKRAEKRGKRMLSLRDVLSLLLEGATLPKKYRDHALTGDWNGYRELHIEPDWLLIYRVQGDELQLARTGTHADLFR